MHKIFLVIILVIGTILSISNGYAEKNETNTTTDASNLYFQINIPDNWIYTEYSDSYATQLLGFGPRNAINAVPSEFYENSLLNQTNVTSTFKQDTYYPVKNAPLDMYVKYKINEQPLMEVTKQENTTINDKNAIKIYGNGIKSLQGFNLIEYFVFNEKEPYYIGYMADQKNYQKYLPEFEHIVKSFKFIE